MTSKLVLTVGNSMMGDDAAGPRLAEMLQREPVEGWEVIDGGSSPENEMHRIREHHPDEVLIVDATEMGLQPGELRMVPEEVIAAQFFMTTHNLPLTYLIQSLKEFVPRVTFLAIQPQTVAFTYPISPGVKQAVERVYGLLKTAHFEIPSL